MDKAEDGIIEFGDVIPPHFQVPQDFIDSVGNDTVCDTRQLNRGIKCDDEPMPDYDINQWRDPISKEYKNE